jgi:hypothetical protein
MLTEWMQPVLERTYNRLTYEGIMKTDATELSRGNFSFEKLSSVFSAFFSTESNTKQWGIALRRLRQ